MKRKVFWLLLVLLQTAMLNAQQWCGNSFVVVNNLWYTGSNAYIHTGGKFANANLGTLSESISLGGELQVYPSTDNQAEMYYSIDGGSFTAIALPRVGQESNNSKHQGFANVDISHLTAGEHTLEVYFKAGGQTDRAGYVAKFVVPSVATADGQLVTASEQFPRAGQPLTLTFDLSQGNRALAAALSTDALYAHTGVITNLSTSTSDWKYATTWGSNTEAHKLTYVSDNKWQLTIPTDVRSFYGVPVGETIQQLVFVIRNSTGRSVAKTADNKDIAVKIFAEGLQVKFQKPVGEQIITKGTTLNVSFLASENADLQLLQDATLLASQANSSSYQGLHTFNTEGTYLLTAKATAGSSTATESIRVVVQKDVVQAVRPAGTRVGINYISDTEATLVLFAPGKQSVYVLGDFNNWTVNNDYQMNRDGDYWWLTLTGLTAGEEYAYQYLIDGSLRVADAYTEKVLDPWNDAYVPADVYPNLKAYPTGKTEGIVSVLQTAQTPYQWQVTDFKAPAKKDLVIYELHIRDFVEQHSFDAVSQKLDYLQKLGINAIELMPVNEFEGNSSWGYNPSFYFALDKYYGTKNAFKAFVDECHKRGIAVIVDMVLNHSFGQSPLVQMYWDSQKARPSANSPWYNVTSPNTDYSWGYDFNHESTHTQALVDSVNSYWMKEYKVDGFRFDFTKGFTNTVGNGWSYDASRIAILKRMANEIWKRNASAYVILEHLTENGEEMELANAGMMLWGNMNHAYSQNIMGWKSESDLSGAVYTNKGWSVPHLVSYMESHDEERLMYKALSYGNGVAGGYSAKDLNTALQRAQLSAAFYLLLPGPKMIWQFGELGYDYSINSNGTAISTDYRTAPKPIRWDYLEDSNRKAVYNAYAKLNNVKATNPAFAASNVSYAIGADNITKYVVWNGENQDAFVVGNFDVAPQSVTVPLPQAGVWKNVFTDQKVEFTYPSYTVTLAPGEYQVFIQSDATVDEPLVQEYLDSENFVGGYTASQLQTLGTLYTAYQADKSITNALAVNNEMIRLRDSETKVSFSADKFHRLFDAQNKQPLYVDYNTHSLATRTASDADKVDEFWHLSALEGTATVQNPNTKTALSPTAEVLAAGASTSISNVGVARYAIAYNNATQTVRLSPIDAVNITVKGTYASFCYPFAVTVPTEATPFRSTGSFASDGSLLLTSLDGVVPALTPTLLQAPAGTYSLPIAYGDTSPVNADSKLQGTLTPATLTLGDYILKTIDGATRFYATTDNNTKLGANKVYLPKSNVPTSGASIIGIATDGTTGIASLKVTADKAVKYFHLNGVQAERPLRGQLYITSDGRKVIFK